MGLPVKLLKSSLIALLCLSPAICAAGFDMPSVQDYGAVGNGVVDDSAAFNQCLAKNQTCWVSSGMTFKIGNVKMRPGNRLQGMGVMDYAANTASTTAVRPLLKGNGAEFMIDVTAVAGKPYGPGGAIVGVFIDCGDTSNVNGISYGSGGLTVENVTVVNCLVGLGGGDNKGRYTEGVHIHHSSFGYNGTGVQYIVDSFISDSDFSNNLGDGLYLGGGSNANSITNTRFEWNDEHGIESYLDNEGNSISNCFFDRNKKAGVAIIRDHGMTLSNNTFFGNGTDRAAPRGNSQIYIEASRNVSITGGVSKVQRMDKGLPYNPQYVLAFGGASATNTNIAIVGLMSGGLYDAIKNPHGGFTVGVIGGAANQPASKYVLQGVLDTADIKR